MTPLSRFARFGAVGALGMGVQLTVLWVLVAVQGAPYVPATIVAVSMAIVHNFLWHQRWTWVDRSGPASAVAAFVRFAVGNGLVSLVGNAIATVALVGGAGFHPVAANVAAIAVCGLVNFTFADRVVFGLRHAGERPVLGLR